MYPTKVGLKRRTVRRSGKVPSTEISKREKKCR